MAYYIPGSIWNMDGGHIHYIIYIIHSRLHAWQLDINFYKVFVFFVWLN